MMVRFDGKQHTRQFINKKGRDGKLGVDLATKH
jgi:hypothetical protein